MRDNSQVYAENLKPRTGVTSSDTIDFGVGTDYGKTDGQNFLQVRVLEDFAGNGTVKIALQHSDNDATYSPVIEKEFSVADLKAGKMAICQSVPVGFKQYSKVDVTLSGAMTAGALTAWIGTREEA